MFGSTARRDMKGGRPEFHSRRISSCSLGSGSSYSSGSDESNIFPPHRHDMALSGQGQRQNISNRLENSDSQPYFLVDGRYNQTSTRATPAGNCTARMSDTPIATSCSCHSSRKNSYANRQRSRSFKVHLEMQSECHD